MQVPVLCLRHNEQDEEIEMDAQYPTLGDARREARRAGELNPPKYQACDNMVEYNGQRVRVIGRWRSPKGWWQYEIVPFDADSYAIPTIVMESELSDWSEFDDVATIGNVAMFIARGEYEKAEATLREMPEAARSLASVVGTQLDTMASFLKLTAK